MKKTLLFGLILIFYATAHGQFFDNYGLRIGAGLSNQYWEYKNEVFSDFSEWKENKLGLITYINAEKNINKYISIRPEIGYIQKGFKEEITFTDEEGFEINTESSIVTLHNLSLNIGGKYTPVDTKIKPFLIVGLRGDYLLGYKDFEVEFEGKTYGLYKSFLDDYEKFVLSGLIGIGIDFNDLVYFDLEYNPALTKNLNEDLLSIKDRFIGMTIGINISEIFIKTE